MRDFQIKVKNVSHLKKILKLCESLGIYWSDGKFATDMTAMCGQEKHVISIECMNGELWYSVITAQYFNIPVITIKDLEKEVMKKVGIQ